MSHRNARLTVYARRLLVARVITEGRLAHVVKALGCSRATGYKWLARWRAEGEAGLVDRPSTAYRLSRKTPAPTPYRHGCTPTITTTATPHQAANHPSAASTTPLDITPGACVSVPATRPP